MKQVLDMQRQVTQSLLLICYSQVKKTDKKHINRVEGGEHSDGSKYICYTIVYCSWRVAAYGRKTVGIFAP